jgi:hypothetical protein
MDHPTDDVPQGTYLHTLASARGDELRTSGMNLWQTLAAHRGRVLSWDVGIHTMLGHGRPNDNPFLFPVLTARNGE